MLVHHSVWIVSGTSFHDICRISVYGYNKQGFVSQEKYRQAISCWSSEVRLGSVAHGREKVKSNFVKSVPKESKRVMKWLQACNGVTEEGKIKERIGFWHSVLWSSECLMADTSGHVKHNRWRYSGHVPGDPPFECDCCGRHHISGLSRTQCARRCYVVWTPNWNQDSTGPVPYRLYTRGRN